MRSHCGAFIFCGLLTLLCVSGTANAQQVPEDSSSQRILPLPEGKLSDLQTQMQLLHRLRSLVAASEDTEKPDKPTPEDASNIDDKQLEQLQQALKKLQDQLPPGIKPPDLQSIPKEQLDEAMSNPAVQHQLKKMLEQFSKDGLLPKNGNGADNSQLPPIPRRPEQPSTRPSENQPQPPQPDKQSWQSLKDAMKKLSDIAQGGKEKSPENDKTNQDADTPANGDKLLPGPSPQRKSGDEPQPRDTPPRTDRSDAERGESEPSDQVSNNETQQPSLKAFQDLLERYKNSQRNQPSNDGTDQPGLDDKRLPEVRPGMRSPRTESGSENSRGSVRPESSKRVMRRPDRATPDGPPVNSVPGTLEQSDVISPAENLPRNSPPSPTGHDEDTEVPGERQFENFPESRSSEDLLPSVSEFLKDQLRKGLLTPGNDGSTQDLRSLATNDSPDVTPRSNLNRSKTPPSRMPNEGTRTEQSGVDIRNELEKRGLRGTLEKLIEKAKEESKAQQNLQQEAVAGQPGIDVPQPDHTGSQNTQLKTPGDSGLQKSLADLLSGLDDDMQDIVKDAKFKDRSADSKQPRDSPRQQSPTDSDSRLNKWNDAASDFLSDLSTAPQAPTPSRSIPGDGSPVSADSPLAMVSFLLVGLGLLGLVAVLAVLMRRPLLNLVSDATGITGPKRVFKTREIRSREDVIAAFHELALSPQRLVESWWTHRAAAQKLAAELPQQGQAVQTLVEIYEQARYLPDDIELPADKIQSVRTALAECQ